MNFDSENVLNLLYSYNPWWKTGVVQKDFNKPMHRVAYFESEKAFFNNEVRRIVLLSGARRTGKTTIMYQMIAKLIESGVSPKNIMFVSFDHPLLKQCNINEVSDMFFKNITTSEEVYCFFDEIQYSPDWNLWLKVFYDTNVHIKIMATGSASLTLGEKTKESGLGRWKTIHVPTLTFYEYCVLLGINVPDLPREIKLFELYNFDSAEQSNIMQKLSFLQPHFTRFLQVGGFPELALSKDDLYAQRILREDIVDKALKRDLPSVYALRNITDIEKVFMYLCFNSSNIINMNTICKELQISRNTLEKYILYLEGSNLIYISPLVNVGSKQILKSQNKIYITDSALRNAVLMHDDIASDPVDAGVVAETAVFKHIKTFNAVSITRLGYYRDSTSDKEIDIIAQYGTINTPIMIEVKYREDASISSKDIIVQLSSPNKPNLVITKRSEDYGLQTYDNGNQIYKISAHAFLYLLGYVEMINV